MSDLIKSLNITELAWLNALMVFVSYLIISFIVNFLITKILKRLAKKTKTIVDDKLIDIIHRPVYFTIILIGVVAAISGLDIPEKLFFNSRDIIYTLMVLIWMITIFRISNIIIKNAIFKISDVTGLSKDLVPLVDNITKIVAFVVALMVILSVWKIDITPLWASAGIASVVVALAARDTIANFFGGISVYMDKPYKISDYIELDTGERGEVVDIGIRSTRIKTRDDIMITIPNSTIANSKVVNESAPIPKFRVRIPIGVAYGSDIKKVEEILINIATDNSNIVDDPCPIVRFRQFGDSSLNFELLCWAHEPAIRGKTIHEINTEIYNKFKDEQIVIPFPQRDIHYYGKS